MKLISITIGNRFIGSHTCLLLLEKGYEIFIKVSFEKVNKVKIDCRFVERREGDNCEFVSDNSLAKSLFIGDQLET